MLEILGLMETPLATNSPKRNGKGDPCPVHLNHFPACVTDIIVYSVYPYDGSYDQTGTSTMDSRYIGHEY